MFGERCYGLPHCGHATNWTCACTCDEKEGQAQSTTAGISPQPDYSGKEHSVSCKANDLDPMDHTVCTCGLRQKFNPWGRNDRVQNQENSE